MIAPLTRRSPDCTPKEAATRAKRPQSFALDINFRLEPPADAKKRGVGARARLNAHEAHRQRNCACARQRVHRGANKSIVADRLPANIRNMIFLFCFLRFSSFEKNDRQPTHPAAANTDAASPLPLPHGTSAIEVRSRMVAASARLSIAFIICKTKIFAAFSRSSIRRPQTEDHRPTRSRLHRRRRGQHCARRLGSPRVHQFLQNTKTKMFSVLATIVDCAFGSRASFYKIVVDGVRCERRL